MLPACRQSVFCPGNRIVHWARAGLIGGMMALPAGVFGQSIFDFVQTGKGGVTTVTRELSIDAPFLLFEFGFGSAESVEAGTFPDSATATFQTIGGSPATLVVSTLDITGAVWAPPSPGAINLLESAIERLEIEFPSTLPTFAVQRSFLVKIQTPEEFLGRDVNFYLDLFDNGNGLESIAWVGRVETVPEPTVGALLGLGAVAWMLGKRRKR